MITNVYRTLAEKYHWTLEQIYNMTHYQWYWFLNSDENVDTATFATVEDYRKWHERRFPNKPLSQKTGTILQTMGE